MAHANEFAIVPTEEQLQALDRELRYVPVANPSPKALTAEQVAAFDRDGFLIGLPVFEAAEASAFRDYFDALLAEALAAGGNPYSISSAHLRHARIYDLLGDARIVDPIADLLGDDVVGWGAHFFCKLPGDGKRVDWHQDAAYWPMTPAKTVTVWLAVDDADAENACMRFLPGSHREGRIPYRESDADDANVLTQTVENVERFGEPVDDALAAGSMSLHHDLLLHGSPANASNRRRCGLTLRYCAAEVRASLGWDRKGRVVRGRDRAGYWNPPERPDRD